MKKVLLMIIYFVLLLGLVGCNNNNKNYGPVQVQVFSIRCSPTETSTEAQNEVNNWLSSKGNTIKVISTDYKVMTTGDVYAATTYYIMITYQEKIK